MAAVKSQSRAMWLALAAVACWSTVASAFKLTLAHLGPAALLFWAVLVSALLLALVVSVRRQWRCLLRALRQRPGYYLLLSALNPCAYYLLLFAAYDRLPAQQAQPINYSWALLLALLAVPMLGQRLGRADLAALVLGYFGVLVIATGGPFWQLQFTDPLGVGLALLSTLIWALYWLLNARNQEPPEVALLLCFALALLPLGGLALWLGSGWPSPVALAGALYIGLFEMGISFLLWLAALRAATHTARIANLIFLSPFISLYLISVLLDETIAPASLIGLVLIIAAVGLQQLAAQRTASRG